MAKSYDAMRCNFVDEEIEQYVENVKELAVKVKRSIMRDDVSDELSDKAVRKTIAFLKQPFPEISDEEETTGTAGPTVDTSLIEDLKSEVADLRKEVADLRAAQQSSKQQMKKELKKEMKKELKKEMKKELKKEMDKEMKAMKTANALSAHTLEKNLSNVRSFIKRNIQSQGAGDASNARCSGDSKKAQGATAMIPGAFETTSEAIEFPIPTLPVKVDLKFEDKLFLRKPGDTSVMIKDCVALSEEILFLGEYDGEKSRLVRYDFQGKRQTVVLQYEKECNINLAVIQPGCWLAAAFPNFIWKMPFHRIEIFQKIYQAQSDIDGIAVVDSSTLAAATEDKIVLMDMYGNVYKTLQGTSGRVIDMCATTDGDLVVLQTDGISKRSLYDDDPLVTKVPQIQAPSSVAAYVEGHFFVCDSKENSLYLLGPDGKTIQQKWSLANLLKSNDELLTVSVLGQKCVLATKFGFVLIFNIN